VIGFVDDEWPGIGQVRKRGLLVLASLAEVPGVLRSQVVDEVAIALPVKSLYGRISEIVALCEEQGIVVRFVREMFDSRLGRSQTEEFEDGPIMTFYTGGMHGWAVGVKRVIDVCCSLILLMMLSPLFLVVAVLIKILSPGPVFFVQERVGLNKRRFRMYKFRTMVADAEQKLSEVQHLNEVSGPVFKITNDPRLTSIGKYLRKTSIDELPQLISVLKGEMSLVGPRPLPERDFEGFDKDWQRRRLSVRPGITCLWQVNGRSDIAFDNWMKLDMEYIDQWSLWLDVKILAQTIPAVLRGVGAR
jgi:exopolysaccharide biosynthesis polyprenyl glycosylphosphotransferase